MVQGQAGPSSAHARCLKILVAHLRKEPDLQQNLSLAASFRYCIRAQKRLLQSLLRDYHVHSS